VEEQFYAVWSWLALFVPDALLAPVVLGGIAFAPAFRLYGVLTDTSGLAVYVSPLASLDSLGMGALVALGASGPWRRARLARRGWDRLVFPVGLAGTVLCYALAYHTRWWRAGQVVFDTALALFWAWLVGTAASRPFGGVAGVVLGGRPLVYLARSATGCTSTTRSRPWG